MFPSFVQLTLYIAYNKQGPLNVSKEISANAQAKEIPKIH